MAVSPRPVSEGLIGRDTEIGRLDAVLDRLRERGAALIIRGEAGIGKSALLGCCRERASSLGARALTTIGVESEAELAFAGLHQLLRPITRRMDLLPVPQREVLDAAFGLAATLEPDPYRVALAAYELVCEAAGAAPLLLTVDDAQWLDRSSLGALAFIGRRLESEPVVLVASVRDGYETTLDDAGFPTLRVERLSDSAAAELLDRDASGLTPTTRAGVLAEAAGNPLGLLELARAAPRPHNGGETLAAAPMTLTTRLEHAFASRLDELSDETRALLLAAALDSDASLDELVDAAIRVRGHVVTIASLDEAAALGLAELADTHVRFHHPLIRSAVRQMAPPAQVLAMYAALAAAVADPERGMWHRAMAAVGADEQVATELEGYAQAARRRGAVAVAASALERAALLSDDPHRKGDRLVRAAELAYDLGLVDVVRRLLREAEPLEVRELEAARLAWLKEMVAGDMWFEAGATKTFVKIAEQMRDRGDPDMALRSLVPIALRCWWTHPRTRTRQYLVDAAESVDVARDDPRLLAVIALAHPEGCGRSVLQRIAGTRLSDVSDPVAAMDIGVAAGAVGDWATGLPFLARAVERLREQGRLGMLTQALVYYGLAGIDAGDWQAAAAAGAEAARLARDSRQPQYGLAGEVIAAQVAALRGTDDVERMLARPERVLIATKSWPMLAPVHLARAAAALGEGRHEDAFEQLWLVFDRNNPTSHPFFPWSAILDLVESGGRGEHAQQVASVVAELERVASTSNPPILGAGLACARPLMASDEEADGLFLAALDRELSNYPFLHARTLFSYGSWLRRRRRSAESRQPLRSARELFDALGAARWSERARGELRATGETIGPRTPDARDRLTAQELQIAQLAAEGLSNREIGERLFLSHRTIGSHLYRIFPKLGITARAQLRDALAAPAAGG
jgi:DNA-binding CsgD family transcriptional regulator